MLPLCTKVNDLRLLMMAYCRARLTRRFEQNFEIGLIPGKTFHPGNRALVAVGSGDGCVKNPLGSPPDIGTDAVAFDEGDYWVAGTLGFASDKLDFFPGRNCNTVEFLIHDLSHCRN